MLKRQTRFPDKAANFGLWNQVKKERRRIVEELGQVCLRILMQLTHKNNCGLISAHI
jgi:hypothetical protein